jgi:cytochrome c-type biogenesis protein CcmH
MKRLLAIVLLAFSSAVFAQADEIANPDPRVEKRLKDLAEDLRCLVCQNQTIADSNAPLALDLRNQIRTMVGQGKSDDEIRAYLVDRYGNYVLYKPPLIASTFLLWGGPFLLLIVGIAVAVVVVRRKRSQQAPAPLAPEARARIDKLLE